MKSNLKNGIIRILAANVLNMCISIFTNLILPKNLSIEAYAGIKTYQLYLSYVGILHFGFVDGIYLKYGGKDFASINWKQLQSAVSSFRIFQVMIMCLGIVSAVFVRDWILMIVSFMILPTNMLSFFKYLYQACGEYSAYGKIINLVSIATLAVNCVLVLIIHTDEHMIYLLGYLTVNLFIYFRIEQMFQKKYDKYQGFTIELSVNELICNMKNGILLTLGNFTSTLTTTMDRWFVKFLIGTVGFAQYSFAVSMENFLNAAVTPVSITLYNTLCIDHSKAAVKKYRELVVLFASVIVASAFPVKFITEIYLQKYYDSTSVVFLLFSSQIYYIVTKSIYVNLYKAQKEQKRYFLKLIIAVTVGACLNFAAYFICNIKESYAVSTALTSIFWFLLVQADFKENRISVNEMLYMIVATIAFWISGFCFGSIRGLILYLLIVSIDAVLFMAKPMSVAIHILRSAFNLEELKLKR